MTLGYIAKRTAAVAVVWIASLVWFALALDAYELERTGACEQCTLLQYK